MAAHIFPFVPGALLILEPREVKAELCLKLLDALEYLFERRLLDAGEFFGIDVVVRLAVFLDKGFDLPHKSLLHEIAVHRIELLVLLGGYFFLAQQGFEAAQRVGFCDAVIQGIDAGIVNHRLHGGFDVETVTVFTLGLDQKIPEKADRRSKEHGVFSQVPEKSGPSDQGFEQMLAQLLDEVYISICRQRIRGRCDR